MEFSFLHQLFFLPYLFELDICFLIVHVFYYFLRYKETKVAGCSQMKLFDGQLLKYRELILDGPSIMVMIVVGYVLWVHFQDS